jgi:hypothetical protein
MIDHALFLASPFLIGLAWSVASPFLVRRLGDRYEQRITEKLEASGFRKDSSGQWRAATKEELDTATGLASPQTVRRSAPPPVAREQSGLTFAESVERVVVDRGELTFHIRRGWLPAVAGRLRDDPAPGTERRAEDGSTPADDSYLPLAVEPGNLRTYVDWIVDVPQLVPTILLAVVGVFVALAEGRYLVLTIITCVAAAVIGAIATIVIMRKDPQHYSAVDGIWIFTRGSQIAFIVNLIAAAVIIVSVGV